MDPWTPLWLAAFAATALAQLASGLLLRLLLGPRTFQERPHVEFLPTHVNRALWDGGLRDLLSSFAPSPWAPWAEAQTLFGNLGARPRRSYSRREAVRMADGAEVQLDWKEGGDMREDAPLLVVCPGIAGGCDSGAAVVLTDAAADRGWRSVVYSRRGHGRGYGCGSAALPAQASYPTHCDVDDMDRVAQHARAAYPDAPLLLAGVSAGACLAVKYLGERASASPFLAAVSLSNGLELVPLTRWLVAQPQAGAIMLTALRQLLRANAEAAVAMARDRGAWPGEDPARVVASLLHEPTDVRRFEARLTMPLSRSPAVDVDDYYRRNSCHEALARVRCPLLVLAAQDDPLIPPTLHEHALAAARANAHVISVLTRRGGHLGWLTGWRGRSWALPAAMRFLELAHG